MQRIDISDWLSDFVFDCSLNNGEEIVVNLNGTDICQAVIIRDDYAGIDFKLKKTNNLPTDIEKRLESVANASKAKGYGEEKKAVIGFEDWTLLFYLATKVLDEPHIKNNEDYDPTRKRMISNGEKLDLVVEEVKAQNDAWKKGVELDFNDWVWLYRLAEKAIG